MSERDPSHPADSAPDHRESAGTPGPWAGIGEWDPFATHPVKESVRAGDAVLRVGDRVRLVPKPGGDIWDLALRGRTAVIESIEVDFEDTVHLAVVVDDDPGRDLGLDRQVGHRFFYKLDDVEPVSGEEAT
jgi:hypothetical protein